MDIHKSLGYPGSFRPEEPSTPASPGLALVPAPPEPPRKSLLKRFQEANRRRLDKSGSTFCYLVARVWWHGPRTSRRWALQANPKTQPYPGEEPAQVVVAISVLGAVLAPLVLPFRLLSAAVGAAFRFATWLWFGSILSGGEDG